MQSSASDGGGGGNAVSKTTNRRIGPDSPALPAKYTGASYWVTAEVGRVTAVSFGLLAVAMLDPSFTPGAYKLNRPPDMVRISETLV
jgi:hypothetical protein